MDGLKEAFSRENLLKDLNFFVLLNLGLVLTAVGIVYFKNPNHFAFGGTSGLSILLADLFPRINVGGFMWIINLILVVLGFVFLGIKTMGWTIYSSFALSFFVSVCEWLYPVNVSMSGDAMLDLVFAVFLPALGAAIVFDIGASTGGTDIVAAMVSKYRQISVGRMILYVDMIIISSSYLLYHDLDRVIYGFVVLVFLSYMTDQVVNNNRQAIQFTIISKQWDKIATVVNKEMHRGCTVLEGTGWDTKQEVKKLIIFCRKMEALQGYRIIKELDPKAFVSQGNVNTVYGEGFDQNRVKARKRIEAIDKLIAEETKDEKTQA